jgi:6-phosphogluconolactonase
MKTRLATLTVWLALIALGQTQYVYVANYSNLHPEGISGYVIGDGGELIALPDAPFPADAYASSIGIHPDKQFFYLGHIGANCYAKLYRIDRDTGRLTRVHNEPLPFRGCPVGFAFHPNGQFAFVIMRGANFSLIQACRVDVQTGDLAPIGIALSTGLGQAGANSVVIDPTGRFVYVANFLTDNVAAFRVNQETGELQEISGSPFQAGVEPRSVAVDPTGQFVYVANCGAPTCDSGGISGYSINQDTGALTAISGSPFRAGRGPSAVAVDPSGYYVYAANFFSRDVSTFAVDPDTGALSKIDDFPAGQDPEALATDAYSQFVYVANLNDGVSAYRIDFDKGSLFPIDGSPFPAGIGPRAIVVVAFK